MGVCGTAISIVVFQNKVSTVALCGYGLTMAGVCLFGLQKHSAAAAAAAAATAFSCKAEKWDADRVQQP